MPTLYFSYWLCTKMFLGLNTVKYQQLKETQSQFPHLQIHHWIGWAGDDRKNARRENVQRWQGTLAWALIPFPRGTRAKPIKQNNDNNKTQTNQNVLDASASKCNKEDTQPQLNTLLCSIRKWDKGIMQKERTSIYPFGRSLGQQLNPRIWVWCRT